MLARNPAGGRRIPTLAELSEYPARGGLDLPPLARAAQGREFDAIVATVRWVDAYLERQVWPRKKLRRDLLARTPREIFEEGSICWAAPCYDLTCATAEVLRTQGFDCTLALSAMQRRTQSVELQFGIELELDGAPHFIGFGRTAKRVQQGSYTVVSHRKAVLRQHLDGDLFDSRYIQLFGVEGVDQVPELLQGFRPGKLRFRLGLLQHAFLLRRAHRRSIQRAREAEPPIVASVGRWQGS